MSRFEEPLGVTKAACLAGAGLALAVGLLTGHLVAAGALTGGLLIGSTNGFLARRALRADLDFRFTSLGRLALLTAAGIGLGAALGWAALPFALGGVALAQLLLAGAAAVAVARPRPL